jgi:hypothetical protein
MTESEEKFVRHSFSFPPELLNRLRGRTDNMSAYVRTLIENDLDNKRAEPDALSATIVVDLARVLVGELDAQKVSNSIGNANQPEMLQAWLRSLVTK